MQRETKPEVWLDILAAAEWYEQAKPGLGGQFVAEADFVLELITEKPLLFPVIKRYKKSNVRRAILRRFPYGVYFYVEDYLLLLSVCHLRRGDKAWKQRVQ